jgi:hypothetical protein
LSSLKNSGVSRHIGLQLDYHRDARTLKIDLNETPKNKNLAGVPNNNQ